MPLSKSLKTEIIRDIEKEEGRVSHLYLDINGYVTVGVGHMIPYKAAMGAVTMYKKGARGLLVLASATEKHIEYDSIKKLPYGKPYGAAVFKKHTTLTMSDTDISALLDNHVQSFYGELSAYYATTNGFASDFDAMPIEVQKALFDMVYNLGITKLKNQFILMNSYIKQEKWADAAQESSRTSVDKTRNDFVEGLFNAAAATTTTP